MRPDGPGTLKSPSRSRTGIPIRARNIRLNGRRTSVKLEPDYWEALGDMARARRKTTAALLQHIADERPTGVKRPTYSSWLRVCCLRFFRERLHASGGPDGPNGHARTCGR